MAQLDAAVVAENLGGARFTVTRPDWRSLRPDLPDEVIAMLAPAVVVSAAAFPSVPRPAPGRHRRT